MATPVYRMLGGVGWRISLEAARLAIVALMLFALRSPICSQLKACRVPSACMAGG
jgi:hypothetical protein